MRLVRSGKWPRLLLRKAMSLVRPREEHFGGHYRRSPRDWPRLFLSCSCPPTLVDDPYTSTSHRDRLLGFLSFDISTTASASASTSRRSVSKAAEEEEEKAPEIVKTVWIVIPSKLFLQALQLLVVPMVFGSLSVHSSSGGMSNVNSLLSTK